MQIITWKRKPLSSMITHAVAGDFSRWLRPRCPECWNLLQERPLEIIADFGDWHMGWRRYDCRNCQGTGARIVLSRSKRYLQYQTHPVC